MKVTSPITLPEYVTIVTSEAYTSANMHDINDTYQLIVRYNNFLKQTPTVKNMAVYFKEINTFPINLLKHETYNAAILFFQATSKTTAKNWSKVFAKKFSFNENTIDYFNKI